MECKGEVMTYEEAMQKIEKLKIKAATEPDSDNYMCPVCRDDGGFLFRIDGYETWIECDCMKKKRAVERMQNSGIIEEDRNKTLDDFKTFGERPLILAKETVKRYMDSFTEIKDNRQNSLLLMGASGRGKTMLGLIAAMNIINNHHVGVRYVSYRNMITELKHVIKDEYTYNAAMNKLISASVLFIDDLYKGKITESDINIMYEIINTRYLARKPLIISTEKTFNELTDVDEAIGSRIIEMSKGYIVQFDRATPNYRTGR